MIKRYVPAVIVASLLFIASSLPSTSLPTLGIEFADFFLHTVAYSVFGFTLGIAFAYDDKNSTKTRNLLIILIVKSGHPFTLLRAVYKGI